MKEFSKFEIADIKRTATTVQKYVQKKVKLQAKIKAMQEEESKLQVMIDNWQAPIKELTGGYTTEDLIATDENGKLVLKYPETVVPLSFDGDLATADAEPSGFAISPSASANVEEDTHPEDLPVMDAVGVGMPPADMD